MQGEKSDTETELRIARRRTIATCPRGGVTILSVIDKSPSAENNSCGDFGLVTSDSDVVEYTVRDYTGKTA